jgi:predicted lipid-binding transport protein (Tim44 family)
MRELEIREINIWSVVKVAFFIFIVIGLCVGLLAFLVVSAAGSLFSSWMGPTAANVALGTFSTMFGLVFALLLSVFYAVMGTIMVFIISFFYNLVARFLGGVTVNVVEKGPVSGSMLYVTDKAGEHGPGEVRA